MSLKKIMRELSPYATIGSFLLALYLYLYPKTIHIVSVAGDNATIESSQLIPFLVIMFLIFTLKGGKK